MPFGGTVDSSAWHKMDGSILQKSDYPFYYAWAEEHAQHLIVDSTEVRVPKKEIFGGEPEITVTDDVTSWKYPDGRLKILLSSTPQSMINGNNNLSVSWEESFINTTYNVIFRNITINTEEFIELKDQLV